MLSTFTNITDRSRRHRPRSRKYGSVRASLCRLCLAAFFLMLGVRQLPAQQPPVGAAFSTTPPGGASVAPGNTLTSLQSGVVVDESQVGTADPVLGNRIARISNELREIPKQDGQIWREYDITPYTKGRNFPASAQPEQTIVDWILRQTGTKIWHSAPFGILTADSEKLYVYHTKEVQLVVADIVDRFVCRQTMNESCTIRVVALSRPDWITKGHQYLKPIPILTPGVQGWVLQKEGCQLLLQELGRRNDFKELAPPQFQIPNGIAHNVVSKRQRTYLRDVQANPTALNGYAEDRVTFDEGFGVSFVPLVTLDGQKIDAFIKLDIVQIEKMISLMVDVPTAVNPRQRVQLESPQVSYFKLDEQIRWPKGNILLLDLGTIPLPNGNQQTESTTFFSGLTRNFSSTNRANILLLIEPLAGVSAQAYPATPASTTSPSILVNGQPQTTIPTIGTNSSYWQGRR